MTVGSRVAALVTVGAVVLAGAACGDDGAGAARTTTVRVLAAASLADAFDALAADFEAEHGGVDVELSTAASSTLREQVLAGAPADVFASADQQDLVELVHAGVVADGPVPFATNRLEIAVPAGNPAGVTGLADFGRADLLLGLCAAEVPCGRLARQALAAAGVTPALDTEAEDVRALLTQVALAELDAGIVYRTDVLAAADDVDGIALPAGAAGEIVLPIAVLEDAAAPAAGAAFMAHVTSAEGRAVLAEHGFGPP